MKYLTLFLISFILISCGSNQLNQPATITGNLSNLVEGTSIYLDYLTPNQLIPKDTASVDADGNYVFDFKIDQLGYYRLRINNQNFINLILKPNEQPVINGDGNNLMDSYRVEGSAGSSQLQAFNLEIKKNYLLQDSLNNYFQANKNNPEVFLEVQQRSIGSENQLKAYYMQIINDNPGTLLSLAAVQQLDPQAFFTQYEKVDQELSKTLPETPYYQIFHEKVKKMSLLATGSEAPNFSLPTPDGTTISLQDLRGKVVLIDFWASWCRPCRAENPNVVLAYNKFKGNGFDVLSVSLDGIPQQVNAKQDWLSAIEKDGLIWKNHVSDLKGWQSEVVKQYGIEGIPFTLLIDQEGKIIAKNLRGVALEQKLEELFS